MRADIAEHLRLAQVQSAAHQHAAHARTAQSHHLFTAIRRSVAFHKSFSIINRLSVRRLILYRQTKSNSLKGVNVLSLASVKIEEFRAERLNYRELMLTIKIQDTKSGRRITSSKVLLLGNGVIEG